MFNPNDNFFQRFIKSPHHLWLAGLTLGLGFLSANALVFLIGAGLYALGWIYLPDLSIYKNWVKGKMDGLAQAADNEKIQAFVARRTSLINQLSMERRNRYQELAGVCQEIIKATRDANQVGEDDPRLRKLDELMWTFLRLLVMEGSLEGFIATESAEGLPEEIKGCKEEVADLEKQVAGVAPGGNATIKQRLLDSKKERLATLVKRQTRLQEAIDNQTLVASEQERLVEQVKLLRSDAIASRNTDALTERINSTVDHLNETNKLISEMDQFKDLVADDLPITTARLGFDTSVSEEPTTGDQNTPGQNRARGNRISA